MNKPALVDAGQGRSREMQKIAADSRPMRPRQPTSHQRPQSSHPLTSKPLGAGNISLAENQALSFSRKMLFREQLLSTHGDCEYPEESAYP